MPSCIRPAPPAPPPPPEPPGPDFSMLCGMLPGSGTQHLDVRLPLITVVPQMHTAAEESHMPV